MKRKIKLKQVIILLLLVFMCVFALSNYKNYKLLKNGYSINEVKEINKNLISDDIKSLIKRNYTKDVIRIIESKKFKPTNFNNYLKLLDELGNYNDKIIDIVNEKYYKRTLSKRYINEIKQIEVSKHIDYGSVQPLLEAKRKESISWLINNIQEHESTLV